MTSESEQRERLAANRIQHMGYPDELSDAERWHCFRGDAELVAASNDVLWERVRKLEAALRRYEKEAPDWLKPIARAALAGRSDG